MTRSLVLAAVSVALTTAPSLAAGSQPTVDLAHTTATFSVKHLTLTTVTGSILAHDVKLTVGPEHVPTSIVADFDLATIDTHEGQRDADLRSDHWFDVTKYPEMTFKSTKIDGSAGALTIAGDLAMHGIAQPVTLTGKYVGAVTDGQSRTHAAYTATTTIDRTAWQLGTSYPDAVVGNHIDITIEVETIATPN